MPEYQEPMRSEIYVTSWLSGFDADPAEITAIVGIEPSDIRRRVERPQVKENEGSVHSGLGPEADLPTQVASLLGRLEPAWQSLFELGPRYDAGIVCVVRSHGGDRPAIWFDSDIVKRAAELNACIDVDLYALP